MLNNFWNLSDGEDILATGNTFEIGGGEIEPIPDNTTAVAIIDDAKWDQDREGNRFISLRWSLVLPVELKNRKVFQKLWVGDDDPRARDAAKKRDKAKRMLAAIDQNAGGRLINSGKAPTDELLSSSLVNKPMQIKILQWEQERDDGTKSRGNWIAAVSPRAGGAGTLKAAAAPKAAVSEDEDAPF